MSAARPGAVVLRPSSCRRRSQLRRLEAQPICLLAAARRGRLSADTDRGARVCGAVHVQWHLDKPSPGDYYKYYLRYVKEGLNAGFAYMERAFMYTGAKCFLQV